jgi:Phage Mu protein F like protein
MRASMPKSRHKTLVRQAAKHADKVKAALTASFSASQVANAWVDSNPHPDTTPQEARNWARTNVVMTSSGIAAALAGIYATGWVLGQDSSNEAIAQASLAAGAQMTPEFRVSLSTNWDTWTPGNRGAAALANPDRGLSNLLAKRDILLKNIDQTTTDRIGTILSRALGDGTGARSAVPELEQMLTDLGENPNRAFTIANTEMNRALNDASKQSYLDSGVTEWTWEVVDPQDDDCLELAGETVTIGEPFSNGWIDYNDSHPNCMCTCSPVVDLLLDEGDSEKAIKPELARPAAAGVPGPYDIERALNRLAILPNPPEANMADIEKYVESPWALVPVPTIDPLAWDNAKVKVVNIADLYATDEYLNRKKVRRHIKAMGQALTPNRSFALVAVVDGVATIIDGHHRLLSMWLLGLDQAPVWLIKE